ncbi:uncharacterized protein TNCV_2699161 [Trichonephila clavipes]|nr:uncharacterized protein TNCV_2699161 [Trichonephila clavipes]
MFSKVGFSTLSPFAEDITAVQAQFSQERDRRRLGRIVWQNKDSTSDESRYIAIFTDGRRRIWRESHEAMHLSCPTAAVQGSGGSIMIWGMFCWNGSDVLMFLECKGTAMRYLDILEDQGLPAMLHFYPDSDGYFMYNNETILRTKSVQNWFPEHQSDFQHLPWLPHSPDLSPIEKV